MRRILSLNLNGLLALGKEVFKAKYFNVVPVGNEIIFNFC
jgi:hypothetical protein